MTDATRVLQESNAALVAENVELRRRLRAIRTWLQDAGHALNVYVDDIDELLDELLS